MSKNFTLDTLIKDNNKKYNETKKIEIGDYKNILLDIHFKPTKIGAMCEDFTETIFYLAQNKQKVNYVDLMHYYIIKHFSSIGALIEAEIVKKKSKSEVQDSNTLDGIKVVCDLTMLKALIDGDLFVGIINQFDETEVKTVYERLDETQKRLIQEIDQVRMEQENAVIQ